MAAPLLAVLLLIARDRTDLRPPKHDVSLARMALLATLVGLPALLAATVLVRHWAAYFACFPALGLALFLGPVLAQQPRHLSVAFLVVFLFLGIQYRGAYSRYERAWTERSFAEASASVKRIHQAFLRLFPTLPHGSRVLLTVESTGTLGVQSTMLEGQALQVWYRDPTIRTIHTLKRTLTFRPEFLVRITAALDLLAIDPDALRVRADTRGPLYVSDVARALTGYARAVAANGEYDRGVRILHQLAAADSAGGNSYYRCLASSFFLAAGRREAAAREVMGIPKLSKEDARQLVGRLLAEPTLSEEVDRASFEAFGLSQNEPEDVRWIMRERRQSGQLGQAAWYATALRALIPTDPECGEVLAEAKQRGFVPSRFPS